MLGRKAASSVSSSAPASASNLPSAPDGQKGQSLLTNPSSAFWVGDLLHGTCSHCSHCLATFTSIRCLLPACASGKRLEEGKSVNSCQRNPLHSLCTYRLVNAPNPVRFTCYLHQHGWAKPVVRHQPHGSGPNGSIQ